MSPTFFRQLFDAPAEIAIAQGRVVLAAISLIGVAIDPTEPPSLALYVQATLLLYAIYALAVLALLHWRVIHELGGTLTHTVDVVVVTSLLVLGDGFSSPFLVFFTFVLLAASLRWDWQGIAATTAALTLLAVAVAIFDFSIARQSFDFKESIIRVAYLIVTATLLGYASAHREHERVRLTRLAQWPAAKPGKDRSGPLAEILEQAVLVLGAGRALAIWDEGEGKRRVALWHDGHCEIFDHSSISVAGPIAPRLADQTFSRTRPDLTTLNLMHRYAPFSDVIDEQFLAKFDIGDFSSAPFCGTIAKGRLFILENIRRSDDHLLITQIVADRVGAELDRQIFLDEASLRAASRERASIMRDLHDGLLQNLTAARAQLELLTSQDEQQKARVQTIRGLLRTEQLRIRQFVDAVKSTDTELVELTSLSSCTDDIALFWGCAVELFTEPAEALVTRKTINQLSLLIAEAVANAVRHGQANHILVRICYADGQMQVDVRDDGQGFPDRKAEQPEPIQGADLPRSLHHRISELQGHFQVWTSASGTRLQFEFPA